MFKQKFKRYYGYAGEKRPAEDNGGEEQMKIIGYDGDSDGSLYTNISSKKSYFTLWK